MFYLLPWKFHLLPWKFYPLPWKFYPLKYASKPSLWNADGGNYDIDETERDAISEID